MVRIQFFILDMASNRGKIPPKVSFLCVKYFIHRVNSCKQISGHRRIETKSRDTGDIDPSENTEREFPFKKISTANTCITEPREFSIRSFTLQKNTIYRRQLNV